MNAVALSIKVWPRNFRIHHICLCISRIMTKKVAKPQNKHAVGLITKILVNVPLSMREKSDFVILLIHSKLFTSMAYKLKQL